MLSHTRALRFVPPRFVCDTILVQHTLNFSIPPPTGILLMGVLFEMEGQLDANDGKIVVENPYAAGSRASARWLAGWFERQLRISPP